MLQEKTFAVKRKFQRSAVLYVTENFTVQILNLGKRVFPQPLPLEKIIQKKLPATGIAAIARLLLSCLMRLEFPPAKITPIALIACHLPL